MKVLLLNPPRSWANGILDHAPKEALPFVHKKLVGPPLGLLQVATALKREHDVVLFDLKGEYDLAKDPEGQQRADPPAALVKRLVAEHRPDVVGVTVMASEFGASMELLRAAKEARPQVLTVVGGVHATLCPEDFDTQPVDVLVTAEGPSTMLEALRVLRQGASFSELRSQVSGIKVRSEDILQAPTARAVKREPAGRDFVLPDRSLLARWTPTYLVGGNPKPITYLFTSLGCPARCTFCSIWPQHKGAYQKRDIDGVVEELSTLGDYSAVRFADADTAADLAWTHSLFDRVLAAGIRQDLVIDLRMDTAAEQPRLVEKMAKAGVRIAISGFESPRANELDRYHKKLTPKHLEEGFRVCEANGIKLRANYVVPSDYTQADFQVLGRFADEHRAAYAGYTVLTPLPGTILYRELRETIVERDLSLYNFFNVVTRTHLPKDRFYEEIGKLWTVRSGTHTIS